MGKGKGGGGGGGGGVDPTFERLNFLHQLAMQCNARLGDEAAPSLGRYYTSVMRSLAHRCVLRLGRNVKRCLAHAAVATLML